MMPVSRAAMNKLVTEGFKVRHRSWAVMNQLVMEGLKVTPRICHDASVQGSHEKAHELSCDFLSWRDSG
jgi:hypothetical protein